MHMDDETRVQHLLQAQKEVYAALRGKSYDERTRLDSKAQAVAVSYVTAQKDRLGWTWKDMAAYTGEPYSTLRNMPRGGASWHVIMACWDAVDSHRSLRKVDVPSAEL